MIYEDRTNALLWNQLPFRGAWLAGDRSLPLKENIEEENNELYRNLAVSSNMGELSYNQVDDYTRLSYQLLSNAIWVSLTTALVVTYSTFWTPLNPQTSLTAY